jgi:hypothetical protein
MIMNTIIKVVIFIGGAILIGKMVAKGMGAK